MSEIEEALKAFLAEMIASAAIEPLIEAIEEQTDTTKGAEHE
jgi:hypothetical protein